MPEAQRLYKVVTDMIPLVDDYVRTMIIQKLRILKENPYLIDLVFRTSNPNTIYQIKEFILKKDVKVVIGFPREQSTLPAYVITLAPEQEQASGLGDNADTYGEDFGEDDKITTTASLYVDDFITSSFISGIYRIECWSDNGALTAYMYVVLKWCLLSSRKEMFDLGWTNIRITGTDLEPVPDYFPVFVYRRTCQLILTYDNQYHEDLNLLLKYMDIIVNPDKYMKNDNGDICTIDGELVVPANHTFILNTHIFNLGDRDPLDEIKPVINTGEAEFPSLVPIISQSELPEIGDTNTLYVKREEDKYITYTWNEVTQKYETGKTNKIVYNKMVIFD